jgi:transcriptional regulator with XRE-family HTH domain
VKQSLRLIRLARRHSLRDVEAIVGVSDNTISRWERGLKEPNEFQREAYRRYLGVSEKRLDELLARAKERPAVGEHGEPLATGRPRKSRSAVSADVAGE